MANKPEKKIPAKPQNHKISKNTPVQKKSLQFPPWTIYAIIVLTAIAYAGSLFNGFASLDDTDYIVKNPYIKEFNFNSVKDIFSTFYVGNYHPLTTLTFFFEKHIYGQNPFPFHLFNLILHLINTFLVYKLIEKLSGQRFSALLVSALFALHPMHVESVAWISERKDVLYTVFYLGALLLYSKYLEADQKKKFYWISLFLFILSLLSKSAAVTLPVIMIAIDIYKRRKINAKIVIEKIPFVLPALLFGVLALFSQQGAMKDISYYSIVDRIFMFTYTIVFYVVKVIAPFKLSAMHYYPDVKSAFLPWYYYASLPLLLLLIWLTIRKTKLLREKIFGVSFFLVVISIMLQIISVGNAITAERYSYVSYIGLFFIAGQWISGIQKESVKKNAVFLSIVFVMIMSFLTWERTKVWKDGNTLFTDIIKKYPENYLPYWMRGNYKNEQKDYQGALQDYNKTLQLYPLFDQCLTNRGHVLIEFKDYQAALQDLNLSIKLNDTVAEAFNNRGMAFDGLRDTAAALKDYNKAIALNPELQKAYNNRGVLKATIGNLNGALNDVNKAISLEPNDGEAFSNRANIRAMMKDYHGAIDDYSTALKFNPRDNVVLFNRGLTRLNVSDTTGACEDWHKSFELGNPTAGQVIKEICK